VIADDRLVQRAHLAGGRRRPRVHHALHDRWRHRRREDSDHGEHDDQLDKGEPSSRQPAAGSRPIDPPRPAARCPLPAAGCLH
jgi:hypothetical protein